ncbi:MAG: ankyrin repeat domain-containing protein [Azovibrio sp.]|uniref:ankyrin repeat domain-containing protein n=1 Tax=Azovibrio sp. TaxID=1872673 RepID=UPI003C767B45
MSLFLEFQKYYPKDWKIISDSMGYFCAADNVKGIDELVERFFSTPLTVRFLEGDIANSSFNEDDIDVNKLICPFLYALSCKSFNVFERLVTVTGNANLQTSFPGDTAILPLLYWAIVTENLSTAKFLLVAGANPNGKIVSGDGEFGLATQVEDEETIDLLLDYGLALTIEDLITMILKFNDFNDSQKKAILKSPGVLTDVRKADGVSALHLACQGERYEIVKWLVSQGAPVNLLDGNGNAPLAHATTSGNKKIIEFLLSHGADPSQSTLPLDIKPLIERLDIIEERLGVRFESIKATRSKRFKEDVFFDYLVEVNFDVIAVDGLLERAFKIVLSAYNEAGELIETESTFINNDHFLGIESIKLSLACKEAPARYRLYPANAI